MNETKQAMRAAFIAMWGRMAYDRMSVKGLCAQAPVARTTFYEHYDNLGALKAEIEDGLIGGLLDLAGGSFENADLAEFFADVFDYIKLNWDANYAFLFAQPNTAYIAKWKSAIKYHFGLHFSDKQGSPNYELILEVIASAVIGAYTYWMAHPDEVDVKKLAEISVHMFDAADNIL